MSNDENPRDTDHECPAQETALPYFPSIWAAAWIGTTLSGGIFGLLPNANNSISGFFFLLGIMIAGFHGAFLLLAFRILNWVLHFKSDNLTMATLAGGATGVFSVYSLGLLVFIRVGTESIGIALLAGCLGASGAWFGGIVQIYEARDLGRASPALKRDALSLADRLKRVAVFVLLITTVSYSVWMVIEARENARKCECKNQLKMSAILLNNHVDTYGTLPLAALKNEEGELVLSWRVVVEDHNFYDVDFEKHMDFLLPWNDPDNAAFLNNYGAMFQCSTRKTPADWETIERITDFIAVTGPGTMWPEEGGREWPDANAEHQPILIVEWPESDIHWAEPRDVTMEEFLDWFRKPVKERNRTHRDCILYVDTASEVGEIPLDADPEEVRRMLLIDPDGA